MKIDSTLKTTPLYNSHIQLGAKMAPFAGWNMPIQYEGIIAETLQTRKNATCFDICHMGEFILHGDYKKSGLDYIITARIDNLAIGSCRYSSMLDTNGNALDDLIIYRIAQEKWMIVVNAATIDKDAANFKKHLARNADFKDLSEKLGKIDLQGPASREALLSICPNIDKLKYYTFMETNILGEKNIVSRTGYTGELGFEIYASHETTKKTWEKLLADKKVKPAGLGARDVLRLEMGYSLYGQDIDETISPLEGGLEKFVDFNKDFVGRDALLKQKKTGLKRTRIFLKTLSRRSPRHNHKIYDENKEVGIITSGSFSPHLETGIGMGFTNTRLEIGKNISVGDETLKIEAMVCDKQFIRNTSLKN
jgi:aminomethyltransferase